MIEQHSFGHLLPKTPLCSLFSLVSTSNIGSTDSASANTLRDFVLANVVSHRASFFENSLGCFHDSSRLRPAYDISMTSFKNPVVLVLLKIFFGVGEGAFT